jgi:hypothetical protein
MIGRLDPSNFKQSCAISPDRANQIARGNGCLEVETFMLWSIRIRRQLDLCGVEATEAVSANCSRNESPTEIMLATPPLGDNASTVAAGAE